MPLYPPGEEMAHMASLMPEQLSSPPLVELSGGFAHRHPVVPCADDEACLRRRRRFHGGVIDRGRHGGHRVRAQQLDGFVHRWPPPTEMRGDHRVHPRIGVYTATPSTSSKCETSAATGLPMETPDTAITVDCGRSQRTKARTSETTRIMPATLISGSISDTAAKRNVVNRGPAGWATRC